MKTNKADLIRIYSEQISDLKKEQERKEEECKCIMLELAEIDSKIELLTKVIFDLQKISA